MTRFKIFALLGLLSLSLAACAPKCLTKCEAFPKMYSERPLAILILPPINETTAADAKEYYTTTIAEPVSLYGYYVYPLEVVFDILKDEGVYDTETLIRAPPQKFRDYFGADAVMYIWIKRWDTTYVVVAANLTVSVRCVLKSTSSGQTLWEYEGTVVEDTTVRVSGGGLVGLAVQAVATAIQTAMTDYVPVAKRVNYVVLTSMPYGKYHPDYDKDRDSKTVQQKGIRPSK